MQIGYCGNVHPGRNLQEVQDNLTRHSLAIKKIVRPNEAMGIGLWLSATTALELANDRRLNDFRKWLEDAGLVPFTFNGFPYGDFHQPIVKHHVYRPTWAEDSRLQFTVRLAEIQSHLLPLSEYGTISTLPLGWPRPGGEDVARNFLDVCARNLRNCANQLGRMREQTGHNTVICIEPEPGCVLDTAEDVVVFFEEFLRTGNAAQDEITGRHIGVCHDICHSAVMFEDQCRAIELYHRAGIRIGKVQVSSAIRVNFDELSAAAKQLALQQLGDFAEPRYLHQTTVKTGTEISFFEDLPLAIQHWPSAAAVRGQWRVHFHVPIYADRLGMIDTTQVEIDNCLDALSKFQCPVDHFEIETYAWNVLPECWQVATLADGIAQEWNWFEGRCRAPRAREN